MKRPSLPTGLSRRAQALLTCGILFATGAIGTTALWSTSAATVSGTFTTATVNIKAGGSKALEFEFPDTLVPGHSTAAIVQVQNVGSIPFTYEATVHSPDLLGQKVTLTARRGNSVSPAGGTCTGGLAVPTASNMTITANPAPFHDSAPDALPKQTGTENLCFQLNLASNAAANLAGLSGDVVFTFHATGA